MTASARPFGLVVLVRTARFFYLLWGGMLLSSLVLANRLRVPEGLWSWPWAANALLSPWGRGVLLGLGLVMATAALIEIWELVDLLLVRFLHDHEHDR